MRILTILFTLVQLPQLIFAASFSLGTWQTTGSEVWSTSFPVNGRSELYFPHSATYTTLNYERDLPSHKKIAVQAGLTTAFTDAKGSDADWDYTKSNNYWYFGDFNTTGKSGYITVDIAKEINKQSGFFWGYSYNVSHYHMTQGHYSIDDFNAVNTDYPNLASNYTMVYQGPHLGVTGRLPLTKNASLVGTAAYSPLALAEGQGWWNLRNMSFSHLGAGQIADAEFGAELGSSKDKLLTIGYRYKYASLYHGQENLSSTISWDKATFIQQGPFVSGKVRF